MSSKKRGEVHSRTLRRLHTGSGDDGLISSQLPRPSSSQAATQRVPLPGDLPSLVSELEETDMGVGLLRLKNILNTVRAGTEVAIAELLRQ